MEARPVAADWAAVHDALGREVDRTVGVLRTVGRPAAPAVGEWTAAEVAVHLSQAWAVVPGLARRDPSVVADVLPGMDLLPGPSLIADLWDLAAVTRDGVRSEPERDLTVIAGRIEQRAEEFLAGCAGLDPHEPRPWIVQGTTVPLGALAGHLLNETVMHGADVARADGRPWAIDRRSAALIIEGFFVPVLAALPPTALVDQERAGGVRAVYQVELRGGGAFRLRFDHGAVHVGPPWGGAVDCRVWADPAALLEVMWGRASQWRAIAGGRLVAWGRRPWLGPRLRRMLRNP